MKEMIFIMSKNILIISSNFTGHGHKSITEALCEKFEEYEDVTVHVVDGFSLGGKSLLGIGKSYGPITRKAEPLWKVVYNLSSINPLLIDNLIEIKIKNNFLRLINKIKPDLILSVHANFNGSIINLLEKNKIKIPFVTLIADLISIYPLWADKRADYIICPTKESWDKCTSYGVSEEKLKLFGFPVRSRFYNHLDDIDVQNRIKNLNKNTPLNCLIMSGGEGVGNMLEIAKVLLNNFNCNIKIITGRNIKLRKKLEAFLVKKYGSRVQVYGFMKNVQNLMLSSDIAFTRASPNVMMEAISCNVPLIITGALSGQEAENPQFTEAHNLGVICSDIKNIKTIVADLLSNNAEKLNRIRQNQKMYSSPHVAKDIADFLVKLNNDNAETKFSEFESDKEA
jgi:processive 1,2-diacylglycerol beta-glucosyltransferase